jgi:lipid II:glycine glycyltransferase (peptidoglycan interpeptide bridge formation enzyme)
VAIQAPNVVVSTTISADEQWRTYEHKVRKNVNKARRNGCAVVRQDDAVGTSRFHTIYEETMNRRGAADRYLFSHDFFAGLATDLRGNCGFYLVYDQKGEAISAELVLTSDQWSYSFLGGTRSDFFHLAPNDLLKHRVIDDTRERGAAGFVLGGGLTPNDGIFRYKRSFAPTGVVGFRTARMVLDAAAYERLSRGQAETEYFPAYRRPSHPS